MSRLLTIAEARDLRSGRRLVFTNGVFDILHAGHVAYLESARALGDLLIVGLNSDVSARGLGKGPGRPVFDLADRARVIGALRCVDGVVSFDEPTPEATIAALRPEVHVKGGDYRADDMPETPLVRSYGGEVVILPYVQGRSTTETLRRLGL
ncbi:MAG: adenylyltransferase/cytidyltransferase family protein [Fimbriimonadaceae bacterium]